MPSHNVPLGAHLGLNGYEYDSYFTTGVTLTSTQAVPGLGFIYTNGDTANLTGNNATVAGFESTNLSILLKSGNANDTVDLYGEKGTTNIADFNGSDHLGIWGSGFANPAAALSALQPTHFGQELALPSGGKIEFYHNTPLTLTSFAHVS